MTTGVYIVSIEEKSTGYVVQSWDFFTKVEALQKYQGLKAVGDEAGGDEIVSVTEITFGVGDTRRPID